MTDVVILELQRAVHWKSYLNIFVAQAVTVALRCPSGRVLRRRFLKSCSSQVRTYLLLTLATVYPHTVREELSHPRSGALSTCEYSMLRVKGISVFCVVGS